MDLVNHRHLPMVEAAPAIDPTRYRISGYLARNGDFYACGYQAHHLLARKITANFYPGEDPYDYQDFLDQQGWAKVSEGNIMYLGSLNQGVHPDPSPEQIQALTTWLRARERTDVNYNMREFSSVEKFLTYVREEA
jgi:hypothetical protein